VATCFVAKAGLQTLEMNENNTNILQKNRDRFMFTGVFTVK
jgi:hypothetical protein